ncbi:CUE domain-containing protein 2 [Chrysoperla carnea]|uniref:CUE domain-containing protein 2 n=1 Tax=Chrysoperla carnea TaxID=189513 RepID=UPI001D06502D|nr:CUE domain-containing protein 2 [Chrysoperla carnea]
MSQNYAEHEETIKKSLFEFMKQYIPNAEFDLIDEIVLSYVVAILEDAGSDPVFDVEGFCEMMSAYFPEFEAINNAAVCQWVFELEAKLRSKDPDQESISLTELSLPDILPTIKPRSHTNSESSILQEPTNNKRVHHISETSDGGSTDSSCYDFFSEEIDILQEMFPDVCSMEVKHCLAIANGEIERATQILLHRQENGLCLNANNALSLTISNKNTKINDSELKNRIIARYSYVDKDSDVREHKPLAPKDEPKKLVRYRDNKIVSLKGERFTEVKKGEDCPDISLKKPKKPHCP